MSSAIIDQLVAIDSTFGQLKTFTGTPPLSSISQIITKYSSYTPEQLDLLFNHVRPEDYRWWQTQYLKAYKLSPIAPLDYSQHPNKDLYDNPVIKAYPSTYITIKTNAGVMAGSGEFDFSLYQYALPTTSLEDKYWLRVMCSMDIEVGSKWAGPTLLDVDYSDLTVKGKIYYTMTNNGEYSIYSNDSLYIKTVRAVDSSNEKWVRFALMRKTGGRDKMLNLINKTFLDDTSICKTSPDQCVSPILTYIKSNPFNASSNKWCDMATATPTPFNTTNAVAVINACKNAYALTNCKLPGYIYKSSFTVKPSNKLLFESFSSNCVSECDAAPQDTDLYNACKEGAIGYCKLENNITLPTCLKDSSKYPELSTMLTTWCSNNKTHPSFATACPSAPSTSATAGTTTVPSTNPSGSSNSATTGTATETTGPSMQTGSAANPVTQPTEFKPTETKGGLSTTIIIVIVVIAFILMAGAVGGVIMFKKHKAKSTYMADGQMEYLNEM